MFIENISLNRRQFLGGVFSTGAFVVASRFLPEEVFAQTAPAGAAIFNTKADTAPLHPSVYLGIEPDGTVFIVTHRSEMGTGIRTSLPPTSSTPTGAAAASSKASATRATATRTPTDRDRFATSMKRSASRARRRSRCSSAPRRHS
jgi:hypothetical protein